MTHDSDTGSQHGSIDAREDRPLAYAVHYASAGCIPDSDPMLFDSLQDARDHVAEEWDDASHIPAGESDPWRNEFGGPTDAYWDVVEAIGRMLPGSGADDPRIGSLYRWTIEAVDAHEVFAALASGTCGIDSCDGDSAYHADSSVDDYRTGAYSRYSWHLCEPSHPGTDGDTWQVRTIRERYIPCSYSGIESADDPVTIAHEGAHCGCNEPDDVDATEVDLLDLLDSGSLPFNL